MSRTSNIRDHFELLKTKEQTPLSDPFPATLNVILVRNPKLFCFFYFLYIALLTTDVVTKQLFRHQDILVKIYTVDLNFSLYNSCTVIQQRSDFELAIIKGSYLS